MTRMTEAVITSDKTARAVFTGILHGEGSLDKIVRKHRLIPRAAERALGELRTAGLVEEADSGLTVTEEGERVAADLRRRDILR